MNEMNVLRIHIFLFLFLFKPPLSISLGFNPFFQTPLVILHWDGSPNILHLACFSISYRPITTALLQSRGHKSKKEKNF